MTTAKTQAAPAKIKFVRERLERRLRHAELLARHPRKGDKWTRVAEDLRRRIARLDG